jgi:autotransporter-associated beta strand protein
MTNITWKKHPGTNDFDTGGNWTGGLVPGSLDTAIFGDSSKTSLTFSSGNTTLRGWAFNKGAPNYAFNVASGHNLTFVGTGISTKGSSVHLTIGGEIDFQSSATAGTAKILNNDVLQFFNSSTAGSAKITNDDALIFLNTSNAGKASITNNLNLTFRDSSTADHATIVTARSAFTVFANTSTGGSARLIAQDGGTVDFSESTNSQLSAGSIEGAGTFDLGGRFVSVGGNNRSTTVSGAVNNGGFGGGSSAVLHKVGTGTLKLSHPGNTYSGGTVLDAGTFDVAALGAAGTTVIDMSGSHTKLKIENAALSAHSFGNVIAEFGLGKSIDLSGLKFVTHAKATLNLMTDALAVKSGKVTDTLFLNSAPADPGHFKVKDDGHGGCKVIFVPLSAKPEADKDVVKQDSNHHGSQSHAGFAAEEGFQFRNFGGLGASSGSGTTDIHLGIGNHESVWLSNGGDQGGNFFDGVATDHVHSFALHDAFL